MEKIQTDYTRKFYQKAHITIVFLVFSMTFSNQMFGQNLFKQELELPVKGLSQRVTRRLEVPPGKKIVLLDESGPGCIFHWWITFSPRADQKRKNQEFDMPHYLRVKFYYDDNPEPDVDVTLGQFFSILQNKDSYTIDNAAIKILPRNALNCYFPIPFEKCRIELENHGDVETRIWSMFDWQEYPDFNITSYRLNVIYKGEFPADSAGSILMADITGEGFIAGMTKSVIKKDNTDAWYHSGGDLTLIDGESSPRAIRGIGGEDVFNMSFGVWDVQTVWVGTPIRNDEPYERVMYRIFGPSPIWFYNSIVMRFGTKANDIETIVYAYVDKKKLKRIITPDSWKLTGPFQCRDYNEFNKEEWPEKPEETWPKSHVVDFNPYIVKYKGMDQKPAIFNVPIEVNSEHGWCDFAGSYRGRQPTNQGAQPEKVSAYASGKVILPSIGKYKLHVGFDDWIKVWVNGKLMITSKHDSGFENESLEIDVSQPDVEIRVKLSNQNNFQWRLWSFNLKFETIQIRK